MATLTASVPVCVLAPVREGGAHCGASRVVPSFGTAARQESPAGNVSDTQITAYWNERASAYSCGVCEELGGEKCQEWARELRERSLGAVLRAQGEGRAPRMLDLGCGPGFFSILFARMGCAVDALDASEGMLAQAQNNVSRANVAESVAFHQGDMTRLPFYDASFDIIAGRNVTWLLRDPRAAYAEWMRVLRPGGKLLIFDANWYRYLDDPSINEQRVADQPTTDILGWNEESIASQDQERRCEAIARDLPFTYIQRPAWDERALSDLGFSGVHCDEDVWLRLWTEGERAFYGSSPMFLIEAIK